MGVYDSEVAKIKRSLESTRRSSKKSKLKSRYINNLDDEIQHTRLRLELLLEISLERQAVPV